MSITIEDGIVVVRGEGLQGPPGPAGPAGATGPQGPAGAGSSTPDVFFNISMADQAVGHPKGAFAAVPYITGATIENRGAGTWNSTTKGFTIPVSGLYDCLGVVRRADGDNIGTWYTNQSIGTVIADVPQSVWSGDISQSRWAMPYARLAYFTAGDVVYHVFRASGGGTSTQFTVKAASLTIGLVRAT